MSIDTIGVRGHVVSVKDATVLECGCKVLCGTYPLVVGSCQELNYKGECVLWKWESEHEKCKGSKSCRVEEEE